MKSETLVSILGDLLKEKGDVEVLILTGLPTYMIRDFNGVAPISDYIRLFKKEPKLDIHISGFAIVGKPYKGPSVSKKWSWS